MSILNKLKTKETVEEEKDVLGGGGVMPSGARDLIIKMAAFHETEKGSIAFILQGTFVDGGEYRTTLYTTSGHDKGQSPTYTNDKGTFFLPGYNLANAICALTTGLEIADDDFGDMLETKSIGVYNSQAKSEVATDVEVVMDAIGKKITLGILHVIENKKDKNPATGKYDIVTNEKREYNDLDRVFHEETKVTLVEAKEEKEEGEFFQKWLDKWDGKPKDTYKPVDGAPSGKSNSAVGNDKAPTKKRVFGKKD